MSAPHTHPFGPASQLLGLLLGLAALLSLGAVPKLIVAVCLVIAALTLVRVPRRLRVAEASVCFGILAVSGAGSLPLAGCALGVLLLLSAPEQGVVPLNAMDRYFVAQDYPGMAAQTHAFVDSDRPLQRPALLAAIDDLAHQVPLARSFVREEAFGVQRFEARRPWFRPEALLTWADEPDEASEAERLQARFALDREPPWRVLVVPRPEGGWRTTLTVHHTAADGTALLVWLDCLLRRYAAHLARRRPEPLPEAVLAPHPRFRDVLDTRGPAWMLRMIRKHVHPLAKLGVKNASLLEDEDATPDVLRYARLTLEPDLLQDLGEAAERQGATRNQLLIAALVLAGTAWRAARNKPARPWRLLVPADLRPVLELDAYLGNFVGSVPLELSLAEVTQDLVGTIRQRVLAGRSLEESIESPVNLGAVSLLLPPWLFRRELRKFDSDPETFWFSTLFSAFRPLPGLALPEDVEVERMWVGGAMQAHPGLGLYLVRDRGRIHIAFAYRPPLIRPQGLADLLDRFLAEVERLAGRA